MVGTDLAQSAVEVGPGGDVVVYLTECPEFSGLEPARLKVLALGRRWPIQSDADPFCRPVLLRRVPNLLSLARFKSSHWVLLTVE